MLINPYRFGYTPTDTDAAAYITAVEVADGQALEAGVRQSIDQFVIGCKADGIWTAIKASCILAGARTLGGALQPLVGPAPTNFNFVAGDYNRKTGIIGNNSNKYLNTNYSGSSSPLNSCHLAVYVTSGMTSSSSVFAGVETALNRLTLYGTTNVSIGVAIKQLDNALTGMPTNSTGLVGASRSASNLVSWRAASTSGTIANNSASDTYGNIAVFARNNNGTIANYNNCRKAFYSSGENLNLTLLDTRVTTLINALAAAIP